MPHTGSREGKRVTELEMTYLEGLTNAEDDGETTFNGGLGLAGNELLQTVVNITFSVVVVGRVELVRCSLSPCRSRGLYIPRQSPSG